MTRGGNDSYPLIFNSNRKFVDAIRASIPNALNRYQDESFHPHITIAYKDVKPDQFKSMWKYYRNKKVRFSIPIEQFCILDNREGQWVIQHEYRLAGGNPDEENQF